MGYTPASKRPVKRLTLPSDSGYWIDYYTTKNWADRKALTAIGTRSSETGEDTLVVAADIAFMRFIADWNLDDGDGNKLPIDQESFDKLSDPDIDALMDALAPVINPSDGQREAVEGEKKDSTKKPSAPSTEPGIESPTNS